MSARLPTVNDRPANPQADRHQEAALRAKLARAAGKACPPWARTHTEAVVEAAMAGVIKARNARDDDAPMAASYLWKVACAATIDELGRRRATSEAATPDPVAQTIVEGLQRLTATRRGPVALFLQGHSVPETARLLAWAPKRAESIVVRGLAELGRGLDDEAARHSKGSGDDARWMRKPFAAVTREGAAAPDDADVDEIWTAVRGDLDGERVATLTERIAKEPIYAEVWRVAMAFADSAAADEEETADAFEVLSGSQDFDDLDEDDTSSAPSAAMIGMIRWIAVAVAAAAAIAVAWWLR